MNVYTISWPRLCDNSLLVSLRKPLIRLLAKSLTIPVLILYNEFMAFRSQNLYRIKHNSQISYMEGMLNDIFDPNLRRIRIANTVFRDSLFLYEPEEARDVFLFEPEDNSWLYNEEDFAGEGFDFIVYVPEALRPQFENAETALLTKMGAEIEYYKLYSKNYKIVWQQLNV